MKKIQSKILILLSCIMFFSSCHTLEHDGFKLNLVNKLTTNKKNEDDILQNNNNNLIAEKKDTSNKKIDGAQKVLKKTSVNPSTNKIKKIKIERFNPKSILNLSEKQLFKKMGESNFVKHEGKLKNHQYYFNNCFVDIFAIKKDTGYFVNLFQRRSVKLNGFLDEESCYKDINKKIKSLKQ